MTANDLGAVLDRVLGRRRPEGQAGRRVVVGLGNPGSKYAGTRHNLGIRCVDRLASAWGIDVSRRRRLFTWGEGDAGGASVALVKPRTYVNESGKAVTAVLASLRARPGDLIVVYDDLDLPAGRIRLRARGGAGGHNGMKSIIAAIGAQDFVRLRIGIGRPAADSDEIEHVLGRPSDDERRTIDEAVDRAAQAVAAVVEDGIDAAMNRFN